MAGFGVNLGYLHEQKLDLKTNQYLNDSNKRTIIFCWNQTVTV